MGREHEIAGARGGRETLRRYGVQHFRELGKLGMKRLADKYFGGSKGEATAWLRKRATEAAIEAGTDARMEARLAAGESGTVEELPVILEPDSDPYWQERVKGSRSAGMELPW